ncbi:MAG: bifunctional acetate--CoA ligase family protein/GNAT family N-acetyltransferase [Saprospiraceae bacterium]|nr:bifunctional acetate--CoA ligase family protein/GNAT family N-acetyltransferase [Saprospiraceae bacterium]
MKVQLQKLFYPKSIAVIGATDRRNSVGFALMENLLVNNYQGAVYPINLKHKTVHGLTAYKGVKDVPGDIDLAIIATPAPTVAKLIIECGQKKIEAAVIISAGFKEVGEQGKKMYDEILKNARKYNIRIVGPNCLGFINTSIHLNASFASRMALKGNVAFISQSGALCTSILDWSVTQNVGFSHLVSIGSTIDVDFHDLIDFFGSDSATSCILIYMESLQNARAFMSAARAYARSKPIIILKAGKSVEGAMAALSHTGSLAGNDQILEAAFKRAGVIRVDTIAELFHCAQALAMHIRPKGNRLAIVTNAGGPGILATDYLIEEGGKLPSLSEITINKLSQVLSFSWSHKNPVDVLGDATPFQYGEAVRACLAEAEVDGVLVILTPQNVTDATEVARVVVDVAKTSGKPVLAAWMGEHDVEGGRTVLEENNIPHFRFPERAVDVFLKIYSYYKNLELLYEFTPAIPEKFSPDRKKAASLINHALRDKRYQLNEFESKQLLSFYDIPVNPGRIVSSEDDAIQFAKSIGFPIAMKIASTDILHKTDVGGVILDLTNDPAVRSAYKRILENVSKNRPEAKIGGVLVEKMLGRKTELLIGAKKDDLFGPAILFGMGGISVEIFKDYSIALPPLNMALAKQLISNTKIYKLLQGYRNLPSIDLENLQYIIYKFSYLLMDFPQIKEIDINPFSIDHESGSVLDAKVVLDPEVVVQVNRPYQHLVISPYPSQYEKNVKLKNGQKVHLRPIRPEDEPLEAGLFERLSKETIYFRFFGYLPAVDHNILSRFTHIDYDREMAIVAEIEEFGQRKLIGVVRIIADGWKESAEYAIVIADDWQGQGLGTFLTDYIFEIARDRGIRKIEADVLATNDSMLRMFKKWGFKFERADATEWHVEKELLE